jgi:hypothetical protein
MLQPAILVLLPSSSSLKGTNTNNLYNKKKESKSSTGTPGPCIYKLKIKKESNSQTIDRALHYYSVNHALAKRYFMNY